MINLSQAMFLFWKGIINFYFYLFAIFNVRFIILTVACMGRIRKELTLWTSTK